MSVNLSRSPKFKITLTKMLQRTQIKMDLVMTRRVINYNNKAVFSKMVAIIVLNSLSLNRWVPLSHHQLIAKIKIKKLDAVDKLDIFNKRQKN